MSYWIPHICIISPEGLQVEMENDLRKYLAGYRLMYKFEKLTETFILKCSITKETSDYAGN